MAPNEQLSFAPDSPSVALDARTVSLQAGGARPPKVLARGPFWARLPALRTMRSSVGDPHSQTEGTNSPVPPPIVLPDRVSAARILLSDTQACVQKLSARMDMLGTRSEQALKEVQLAREALDAGGEKTVAEIADVVYKCQVALTKSIETQGSSLDKVVNDIAKLTISSNALFKLYEMQNTSIASLTQNMHAITIAMQSIQALHAQVASVLTPIEPLVRSFPTHVDALKPALERVIVDALERLMPRSQMSAYMHAQNAPEHQTPRGIKRKRVFEETLPLSDGPPVRRRSSMAPPSSIAQVAREQSSPLLNREHRRSAILSTGRLRSCNSVPSRVASSLNAIMEVPDERAAPALPSQAPAHLDKERTTRRLTLATPHASEVREPVNKRPRTNSSAHIVDTGNTCVNAVNCTPHAVGETPSTAIRSSTKRTQATARITRSAAKANARDQGITPSRVPLGAQQPQSDCPSANNGAERVDNVVADATLLITGSENVAPDTAKKRSNDGSKIESKTSKKRRGAVKGKGRGRKKLSPTSTACLALPSATGSSSALSVEDAGNSSGSKTNGSTNSKASSKATSPKRKTTDKSDTSLKSVASVHGPPNSPSTHPNSSPVVPNSNDAPGSNPAEQINTLRPIDAEASLEGFAKPHTLISLIDASQESSFPAGHMEGGTGDRGGLAAALAHVDRDINFDSGLGMELLLQHHDSAGQEIELTNVYTPSNNRQAGQPSSAVPNTLSRSRPKRFLVVDNDSTETDLLDELFAE